MIRRLVALIVAITSTACVSPLEPCVPQLGPGCRYVAVTYVDGATTIQVRTAVYDPCLPKDVSDKKYPGWTIAPDTIKACPPPRSGLHP